MTEKAEEDVQHEMLLMALQARLHTAQAVPKDATILDVGTGTGTWACQIGQLYPQARVYGIDLRQVVRSDAPANVLFETVDVMTGFPFNTGTFDFVHSRSLLGGITDWPKYLTNLHRITKRGGVVECIELELRPYSRGESSRQCIDQWTREIATLLRTTSLDPDIAASLGTHMTAAGFSKVNDECIDIPIDACDDRATNKISCLAMQFYQTQLSAWFCGTMVERGLCTEEDAEAMRTQVMAELGQSGLQAFWRWHFVTGYK